MASARLEREDLAGQTADAIAEVLRLLEERPEDNGMLLFEDLMAGRRPRRCPLTMGRGASAYELAHQAPKEWGGPPPPPEVALLNALRGIVQGAETGDTYSPCVGADVAGTANVASAFGAEADLGNPYNPGGTKNKVPLQAFDDFETPDVNTAGVFPMIKERSLYFREHLPAEIKIGMADLQGPINNAHMIVGTELFLAMRTDPERVHRLLQRITDFMIQCYGTLREWIGEEHRVHFIRDTNCIRECSVNLISREAYREFGLPYDLQIAEFLGEVAIHPCSGLHVYQETMRALPGVRFNEWGRVQAAFAPCVTLDEALAEVGDRQVILRGGDEITEGDPEQLVKEDFARLEEHDAMAFGYCLVKWRKEDEPELRALRRRLVDYYDDRYAP